MQTDGLSCQQAVLSMSQMHLQALPHPLMALNFPEPINACYVDMSACGYSCELPIDFLNIRQMIWKKNLIPF